MKFKTLLPSTSRPILALDLKATGADPRHDRIVEIALIQVYFDGAVAEFEARIHPGCPIPAKASSVHGITDAHVAHCLPFRAYAQVIADQVRGHDLLGFGIRWFDLPLLYAECLRAGVKLNLSDVRVIDVLDIYHAIEPRTLSTAVQSYCGRHHDGTHGSLTHAVASLDVLDGMVSRRRDLPRNLDGLHRRFGSLDLDDIFGLDRGNLFFRRRSPSGQPPLPLTPGAWFLPTDDRPGPAPLRPEWIERAISDSDGTYEPSDSE